MYQTKASCWDPNTRDKSSSQCVTGWTDCRAGLGSLENLDLEDKALLQREWNRNRKEATFWGGGLHGELLSTGNMCTGVKEQGKHQNGHLQRQEEGKYNVCFLHYPKQFSSLIY